MRIHRQLLMAMIALAAVVPLYGAPILNGSFEFGTDPGSFITCSAVGPSCIDDWTIVGEIDYKGTYWVAQDGVRSVDLAAGGSQTATGISQTFATMIGSSYLVSFWMAGNPHGGPVVKSMDVSAAGASQNFTFDVTGYTSDNMGWILRTWQFTAVDTSTTLAFTTMTETSWGPALDNVSVELIPEPGTLLLLGAGIFALAGLARYRRKR